MEGKIHGKNKRNIINDITENDIIVLNSIWENKIIKGILKI